MIAKKFIVAVLWFGCCLGCQQSPPEFAGEQVVVFNVPDMMCPDGCGVAVKEILSRQPGVKDVLIDFEGKTARVAIEEDQFDSDQALAALVDRQFTNSSLKSETISKTPGAKSEAIQ